MTQWSPEWYGLDGLPISYEEANELIGDIKARTVGYDELEIDGEQVEVSTVFLVLDHSLTAEEHTPVLFETLVSGGPHDMEVWRYATREDAVAGHAEVLAQLRRHAQ